MNSYLIINHTTKEITIALFTNNILQSQKKIDKKLTSKDLIPIIDALLKKRSKTISNISFIGINQGPGMFSTLRSIIATMNGLYFSLSIPLIGVDGMKAITNEFYKPDKPYMATLLNACNNEVYYHITQKQKTIAIGYGTIFEVENILNEHAYLQEVYFIGDGTIIHQKQIEQFKSLQVYIPNDIPQSCSLYMIQSIALEKYNMKQYNSYLLPLYLKKHTVERIL